jgi:hypothetical protein
LQSFDSPFRQASASPSFAGGGRLPVGGDFRKRAGKIGLTADVAETTLSTWTYLVDLSEPAHLLGLAAAV